MPRTTFVAGATRILASWANSIDAMVDGVLKGRATPAGIRDVLSSADKALWDPHVDNANDPHNDRMHLFRGNKLVIVPEQPYFGAVDTVYHITGGGVNSPALRLDTFTDPNGTDIALHNSNLNVLGVPWEDYDAAGAAVVCTIQDGHVESAVSAAWVSADHLDSTLRVGIDVLGTLPDNQSAGPMVQAAMTGTVIQTGFYLKIGYPPYTVDIMQIVAGSQIGVYQIALQEKDISLVRNRIEAAVMGNYLYIWVNKGVPFRVNVSAWIAPVPGTRYGFITGPSPGLGQVDNLAVEAIAAPAVYIEA